MNDKVSRFCDNVHKKLGTLAGRMDSLKLNAGSTCHHLQEQLDEVRYEGETTKQGISEARSKLEQWGDEKKAETKDMIDRWIENRETQNSGAGPKGGGLCRDRHRDRPGEHR